MLIFVTYLCSKQCEKAKVYTTCIFSPSSHPPTLSKQLYNTILDNILILLSKSSYTAAVQGISVYIVQEFVFLNQVLTVVHQGFTLKFEHDIIFVLKMFKWKTKSCQMNCYCWMDTFRKFTKGYNIMLTLVWYSLTFLHTSQIQSIAWSIG